MFSRLVRLFTVFSALALAASGQNPPAQPEQKPPDTTAPDTADAPKESAASPAGAAAAVDPNTFVIGPEDGIAIQVWREPEFSRMAVVRPDGRITLPLIKEVQAAGQTPNQLAAQIAKRLSEYVKDPQVDVTVMQVRSQKYYITGEVNKAGSFPLAVPTRVLEALTNAGGFRDFANTKKIVILRKGERLKFNYKEVVKGKNPEQNIFLENGDYIIVP